MFLFTFFIATAVVCTISPGCLGQDVTATFPHLYPHPLHRFLNTQYRRVTTDSNLDQVLKELGVNWFSRKIYERLTPELMLTMDRYNNYTLAHHAHLNHEDVTFKLGATVTKITFDGRSVEAKFTVKENTLTETDTKAGRPTLVTDITFSRKHVIINLNVNDLTSYLVYNVVTKAID